MFLTAGDTAAIVPRIDVCCESWRDVHRLPDPCSSIYAIENTPPALDDWHADTMPQLRGGADVSACHVYKFANEHSRTNLLIYRWHASYECLNDVGFEDRLYFTYYVLKLESL